ncbi:hypothetical protein GPECTOR_222g482 [Gonium pectorale]|uniref:Uncharacterized protein n=1 Tax=Gonium pectorale TaxID=33097 RepID=A0A150FWL7_GONPE|nr:hypothetical protein GPECTOR_222g482 [Gonium pectorale]|eukprot:KXZ42014.1 hypothetical protein GPECTOR_222g482 [Gonium pectorale]
MTAGDMSMRQPRARRLRAAAPELPPGDPRVEVVHFAHSRVAIRTDADGHTLGDRLRKLPVLRRALAAIPPTDVVAVVDALDTLVQPPAAALLESYLAAGAPPFRASTEANCWPPAIAPWCGLFDEHPGGRHLPNRFVNSGGLIGRAAVLSRYVYDAVEALAGRTSPASWLPPSCSSAGPDDQALLACPYLFGNRYGLTLDYDSQFFFSVFLSAHRLASAGPGRGWAVAAGGGGGGRAPAANVTPAFLHCNGGQARRSLGRLKQGLLPSGERAQAAPGFELWVDGRRTRLEALCGGGDGQGG